MSDRKSETNEGTLNRSNRLISYTAEAKLIKGLQIFVTFCLASFIAIPLYWMVLSGFQTTGALFADPSILPDPTSLTLNNFIALLTDTIFPRHLLNSIIAAVGTTILTVILATLGGYGLARSMFRGQRNLARVILFSYMFPPILVGVPLYVFFLRAGLLNSYLGIILAQTSLAVPFCVWLMWQYFQTIPLAYEESGWIYGADRLYTFRKIVLPMAMPGMIAISIFAFAISWSDFTMSVILLTENAMYTFPVGLERFIQLEQIHWGLLNAAGVIIIIPPILLVFFLQKYIMQGFTIGR